jgi:hypothetical protein
MNWLNRPLKPPLAAHLPTLFVNGYKYLLNLIQNVAPYLLIAANNISQQVLILHACLLIANDP